MPSSVRSRAESSSHTGDRHRPAHAIPISRARAKSGDQRIAAYEAAFSRFNALKSLMATIVLCGILFPCLTR